MSKKSSRKGVRTGRLRTRCFIKL